MIHSKTYIRPGITFRVLFFDMNTPKIPPAHQIRPKALEAVVSIVFVEEIGEY
jgi:hypothetical protein